MLEREELRLESLRLECLRLALTRVGANDPRPWRAIADELFGWVRAGEQPAPPAPPARARPPGRAAAAVPRRRR
jgi:hypothetical protein